VNDGFALTGVDGPRHVPALHPLDHGDGAQVQRRKLNLKAKFESGRTKSSFKRLIPGTFSTVFIGFHRIMSDFRCQMSDVR
jgi:hypothetical protein